MKFGKLARLAEKYGLTPDGVEFALSQYQRIICEITHGRLSQLSYYAQDVLALAHDLQCDGCELLERISDVEIENDRYNQEQDYLENNLDEVNGANTNDK